MLLNLSIAHIFASKAILFNYLRKKRCQSDSTLLTPNREDVILELLNGVKREGRVQGFGFQMTQACPRGELA